MAHLSLKKRIWGWYFFDWASQPYHTVLNTFIFGPFFASIAAVYFLNLGLNEELADAKAQSLWAWSTALFGIIIALTAPVFGAMADSTGRRMPWIVGFSIMYLVGSVLLWFTDPAASNLYWMLASFGMGFIGAEYALIFVNAQLPALGTKEEIGKISGSGFAFGYLGGVFSLILVLALIVEQGNGLTIIGLEPIFGLDPEKREGTRATGIVTALWFAVFMIPYFMWVREKPSTAKRASVPQALSSVMISIKGLRNKPSLATYLVSSMLYRDGLNGLYTFGGVYAALVLNWEVSQIGAFGVIAALGAALFSYLGGFADRRFGPKPIIIFSILALIVVSFVIINLSPTTFFCLIGGRNGASRHCIYGLWCVHRRHGWGFAIHQPFAHGAPLRSKRIYRIFWALWPVRAGNRIFSTSVDWDRYPCQRKCTNRYFTGYWFVPIWSHSFNLGKRRRRK